MLRNPLVGQGFNGLHGFVGDPFGVDRAKKTPNVGLRWIEHGVIVLHVHG
jgi:hypothetical protein